jgi:hypothetical protein
MFKKIQQRERTGKPQKPKDISYICIFSKLAPYGKEIIKRTFLGHSSACFAKSPTALEDLASAKETTFQEAKKILRERISGRSVFGKLFNAAGSLKEIDKLKFTDFKKNIFLVFTMEGSATEINQLISEKKYTKLGKRILHVEDNTRELLSDRDTMIKEKNKPPAPHR